MSLMRCLCYLSLLQIFVFFCILSLRLQRSELNEPRVWPLHCLNNFLYFLFLNLFSFLKNVFTEGLNLIRGLIVTLNVKVKMRTTVHAEIIIFNQVNETLHLFLWAIMRISLYDKLCFYPLIPSLCQLRLFKARTKFLSNCTSRRK